MMSWMYILDAEQGIQLGLAEGMLRIHQTNQGNDEARD